MKKVLLINLATNESGVPHAGLAMLTAILKQQGHTVQVADYHFSSALPRVAEVLDSFKPDVVGLSLFSCAVSIAEDVIETTSSREIPLICGGPHAASYHEELSRDKRFHSIVIGEAEDVIADAVKSAVSNNEPPRVIHAPLPDVSKLPLPDYTSFINYEQMDLYPIITSRGCPFNCSFCSIALSNSKVWRPRSPEDCLEELKGIHSKHPSIKGVMIWDDNFSLDIKRAKRFLQMYLNEKLGYKMSLANVRADRIDREFLLLLREAGVEEIQFGVEHGNPEVFKNVGKGETLDDIREAAKMVSDCGMKLGCSFIIGLPHDSLKKTLDSVKFAKELGADHIHWNILVPYKGTKAYAYFKEHGKVDDTAFPHTIPKDVLSFQPNAHTPDFTAEERKKAYLMALFLTRDAKLLHNPKQLFLAALKYRLIIEFLRWFLSSRILRTIFE